MTQEQYLIYKRYLQTHGMDDSADSRRIAQMVNEYEIRNGITDRQVHGSNYRIGNDRAAMLNRGARTTGTKPYHTVSHPAVEHARHISSTLENMQREYEDLLSIPRKVNNE